MKIKVIFVSALFLLVSLFALYWFVRGVFTMQTLAITGSGGTMLLVSADSHPMYFWATLLVWGFVGTAFLLVVVLGIRRHFFKEK